MPSGLLVGLLVGLVLAFVADRRQRRIRGPQDVAKFDVPVLMSLPAKEPEPELEIAAPRSPIGREFSELAHVLVGAMGRGRHVILVSGVSGGHGAGLVAANLAAALSRNQPERHAGLRRPGGIGDPRYGRAAVRRRASPTCWPGPIRSARPGSGRPRRRGCG